MPDATLLRFDQFMARALHDPEHGYYARRISGVGRRGDFTTAPTLSDAPARAMAGWVRSALRETKCRHLIEIGPGEGTLADGILRHLPWLTRHRLQLHLVETSAPLTAIQQSRLGKRAHWHRSITDALDAADGRALIYSNELVDAFPVRRFRLAETGWTELHLETTTPPREVWLPADPLPGSSLFSQSYLPGQIVEVHDSYHDWLRAWLPQWKAGRMLTIDYGGPAASLYHRRPHGSLRAYLFQQRLEGPEIYQNPGRQDITADVNATDLQHWAEPWAVARAFVTQSEFLQPHVRPGHPEDTYLTDPAGAGGAFFVLEQAPASEP
jgi:SAM-dependent MidA family methyltransferase